LNTIATTAAAGYAVARAAPRAEALTHGYTVVFAVSGLLLTAAVLSTALLVSERAEIR
jgi:hypothetical protein